MNFIALLFSAALYCEYLLVMKCSSVSLNVLYNLFIVVVKESIYTSKIYTLPPSYIASHNKNDFIFWTSRLYYG